MECEKKLEFFNALRRNTLMETLDIVYTELGEDYLVATMPVNSKVHQVEGILHGGAIMALAESVAGAASFLFVNSEKYDVKGIEISANHLKSVRENVVTAKATIIHKGKTTHLWQVAIRDEKETLISFCKIVNMIFSK